MSPRALQRLMAWARELRESRDPSRAPEP